MAAQGKTALVVGGGVVGMATALELQREGRAVTLVDTRVEPRPASWGNAGHIAVEQAAPLASIHTLMQTPRRLVSRNGALSLPLADLPAWLPFGLELIAAAAPARFEAGQRALGGLLATALPAWRRLAARLGCADILREDGHYLVWERAATARAARETLLGSSRAAVRYRDLNGPERELIRALLGHEPAGALRCEGTAQITCLPGLMAALEGTFVAAGGILIHSRVMGLQVREGRATAILEGGERPATDIVVVAAGVGSRPLMASLGTRAPLIAERGYHVHAPAHRWPADLPSIAFEDRSLFVTPFRDGLRASSFLELSRPNRPADPRKWQRLRAHLAELNLPVEGELREWMGSRPTLPDYLPAIGRSRRAPNVLYAFGHQHLGLTLAAVTAEVIGALASGAAAAADLAPFDVGRFG